MAELPPIDELLTGPESFRVERTASLKDTDKFCEAICAFANDVANSGLPGYLFIGVSKQGKPSGASITEELLAELDGIRKNGQILPIPSMRVFRYTVGGQSIAVVEVMPSDMPPVRYKQVVHIRTGPSRSVATAEEERRLSERRVDRARTWDTQACRDATTEDLALDLFKATYLPAAVSRQVIDENGRSVEEQLGSLRLFHRQFRVPTNGAVLLFGKDPIAFFPGAYVQYVRHTRGEPGGDTAAERRISGDLMTVLRDLDRLALELEGLHPVRQPDLSEALIADFPSIALHELLVNAVIHRNYEASTTPVMINHFPDRIEILNPGSVYGDLTAADFPNGTSYRNPILAEAAKILGFANRFGSGIARARTALQANGSPPLEYIVGTNHMLMVVRRRT